MDVRTEHPLRGTHARIRAGTGRARSKLKNHSTLSAAKKHVPDGGEDAKGRVTLFLRDPPLTAEDLRGANQLGNFPSRTLHAVVHHRHVEFLLGSQLNLRGLQTTSLFLLALGTAAL